MSYVMVNKIVDVEFDISVDCSECGASLEAEYESNTLQVNPCQVCLKKAKDESYDEGRDFGWQSAQEE